MNIKKPLLLIPIGLLCLTSCNSAVRYNPSYYRLSMTWNAGERFNILQLTDLHMSTLSDREVHYNFIKETFDLANKTLKDNNRGKVNLIVVTGDVFTFADKNVAKDVFSFFDNTLKTPWTVTFGNHDEQCYFSIEWLTSYLNGLNSRRIYENDSYCYFKDLQDDDIFGNANFVIDLTTKEGSSVVTKENIYIFDSNRYNYGEYAGYDYIHTDQIDWYDRMALDSSNYTSNFVPSLAFFHIPFPEFEKFYKKAVEDKTRPSQAKAKFVKDALNEEIVRDKHDTGTTGDPLINTHLFEHLCKFNTNGVFVGHNHTSNYIVEVSDPEIPEFTLKKPITLGFGIKSTDRVYADDDMLGGQIISLSEDQNGDFDIIGINHKYSK